MTKRVAQVRFSPELLLELVKKEVKIDTGTDIITVGPNGVPQDAQVVSFFCDEMNHQICINFTTETDDSIKDWVAGEPLPVIKPTLRSERKEQPK